MKVTIESLRVPIPPLQWFDESLRQISKCMEEPRPVSIGGGTAYRFSKESVENAAFLKLARYVSGLHAGTTLLNGGYFQELCTLQRTLDEFHEDILYLSLPLHGYEKTPEHATFLDAFWEEEPDYSKFSGHQKNRHQIPRKKIRSYLSKVTSNGKPDNGSIASSAYLSRIYSGYVHGAAPQLLELFDHITSNYRVTGFADSPFAKDHSDDFQNQFFRGVLCLTSAPAGQI